MLNGSGAKCGENPKKTQYLLFLKKKGAFWGCGHLRKIAFQRPGCAIYPRYFFFLFAASTKNAVYIPAASWVCKILVVAGKTAFGGDFDLFLLSGVFANVS